jgi:DNA-binding transcriptional regulator YiaG
MVLMDDIVASAIREAPTMPRRDLREMTPAELCCLREDELGMTVRAFAKAIGTNASTVWRWEKGPRPPSKRNAATIAALLDYTDAVVDRVAAAGEPIVTYATDEAFQAGEDTGGWVLPVEWHRMVAWRASERTGARIVYE